MKKSKNIGLEEVVEAFSTTTARTLIERLKWARAVTDWELIIGVWDYERESAPGLLSRLKPEDGYTIAEMKKRAASTAGEFVRKYVEKRDRIRGVYSRSQERIMKSNAIGLFAFSGSMLTFLATSSGIQAAVAFFSCVGVGSYAIELAHSFRLNHYLKQIREYETHRFSKMLVNEFQRARASYANPS